MKFSGLTMTTMVGGGRDIRLVLEPEPGLAGVLEQTPCDDLNHPHIACREDLLHVASNYFLRSPPDFRGMAIRIDLDVTHRSGQPFEMLVQFEYLAAEGAGRVVDPVADHEPPIEH